MRRSIVVCVAVVSFASACGLYVLWNALPLLRSAPIGELQSTRGGNPFCYTLADEIECAAYSGATMTCFEKPCLDIVGGRCDPINATIGKGGHREKYRPGCNTAVVGKAACSYIAVYCNWERQCSDCSFGDPNGTGISSWHCNPGSFIGTQVYDANPSGAPCDCTTTPPGTIITQGKTQHSPFLVAVLNANGYEWSPF